MRGVDAFNRLPGRRRNGPHTEEPSVARLSEALSEHVAARFERLTGLAIVITLIDIPGADTSKETRPTHPHCETVDGRASCTQAWEMHLPELRHRPEPHWHCCEAGYLCAVVPLVYGGQCLAACKLVCPASMDKDTFKRQVEILDILVENFAASKRELLAMLASHDGQVSAAKPRPAASGNPPSHPRVREAIVYIDHHFTDPALTVTGVAQRLRMSPTYLAHLFSAEMGLRMSRYITNHRVERAKKLLAGTQWQIRRVATESGFANADWFSHVFHAHVGCTPSVYRRTHRSRNRNE